MSKKFVCKTFFVLYLHRETLVPIHSVLQMNCSWHRVLHQKNSHSVAEDLCGAMLETLRR